MAALFIFFVVKHGHSKPGGIVEKAKIKALGRSNVRSRSLLAGKRLSRFLCLRVPSIGSTAAEKQHPPAFLPSQLEARSWLRHDFPLRRTEWVQSPTVRDFVSQGLTFCDSHTHSKSTHRDVQARTRCSAFGANCHPVSLPRLGLHARSNS